MRDNGLDFEKPIVELERKIEELRSFTSREDIDLSSEIKKLEDRLVKVKKRSLKILIHGSGFSLPGILKGLIHWIILICS